MKKRLTLLMCILLLTGCNQQPKGETIHLKMIDDIMQIKDCTVVYLHEHHIGANY